MSQYDRILQYMEQFGSISPMEAFSDLGITKLATRISEMKSRKGYTFHKRTETGYNRYGERVTYARYSLNDAE